jgi:hypothetical protein
MVLRVQRLFLERSDYELQGQASAGAPVPRSVPHGLPRTSPRYGVIKHYAPLLCTTPIMYTQVQSHPIPLDISESPYIPFEAGLEKPTHLQKVHGKPSLYSHEKLSIVGEPNFAHRNHILTPPLTPSSPPQSPQSFPVPLPKPSRHSTHPCTFFQNAQHFTISGSTFINQGQNTSMVTGGDNACMWMSSLLPLDAG